MPLPLKAPPPRELRLPTLDDRALPGDRITRRAVTMMVGVLAALAVAAVVVASLVSIDVTVDGAGTLEPVRIWPVRTLEEGTIASVLAHSGDSVRAGQLLVRLDSLALYNSDSQLRTQRLEKRLDRARAVTSLPFQLAQQAEVRAQADAHLMHARAVLLERMAENRLGRNVDSLLTHHVPGAHVAMDLAISDVRAAESELRGADAAHELLLLQRFDLARQDAETQGLEAAIRTTDARLRRLEIRAPADGVVLSEQLEQLPGVLVRAGDQILEIADPREWRATIAVSEHDVHEVHVGDSASIEVPALERYRGGELHGHVVAAALEPGTADSRNGVSGAAVPVSGFGGVSGYRIVISIGAEQLRAIGIEHFRRGYTVHGKVVTRHGRIMALLRAYLMRRDR